MPSAYVRFVTTTLDETSGKRQGVFQLAFDLKRSNQLHDFELEELQTLLTWFSNHLKEPDRLARSRNTRAVNKAISWFKSEATEHLRRMHDLCRILNDHGIRTEMLTSTRPGYIVFEDDHQIAAEPFAETAT